VTGESYLGLMSHWLIPELDKVDLLNCNFATRWASAHYAADVHIFTEQPISTVDGLQSFVKEQLSTICMHSVAELKDEIHCIFNTIIPVML
jgi:hypothetical protein